MCRLRESYIVEIYKNMMMFISMLVVVFLIFRISHAKYTGIITGNRISFNISIEIYPKIKINYMEKEEK